VPACKSAVLRALAVCALRGRGRVERRGKDGTDVKAFAAGLAALGAEIESGKDGFDVLRGVDRRRTEGAAVHVEDGAAPARFLAAIAAVLRRPVALTTGDRLAARPFAGLFDALRALGARIDAPGDAPPATIRGPAHGGALEAALGEETGQFLSALLLVAPALGEPLELAAEGEVRSAGYVAMTVDYLRAAGVRVRSAPGWWLVEPGYGAADPVLRAGADWSSAAPLLAAAAFLDRPVEVRGLSLGDAQPDRAFARHAAAFGLRVEATAAGVRCVGRALHPAVCDVGASPDLAPTLAALAVRAPGETVVCGAPHLRDKESDRIAACVALLRAAGVEAEERPDGFAVRGRPFESRREPFDAPPTGDHRMVQAAALLGLARPVRIPDAACVEKSFPKFFEQFPGVVRPPESAGP
jgi:3-phosphoshikimate 1-carboxyvinyltransferase